MVRRRIAKEVVSCKLYANLKKRCQNSLSLREENSPYYRHTGVTCSKVCTRLLSEFGEHSKHSLKHMKMAESRRQTRSTRRRGAQTDAQFWNNQPDPLLIERAQADAIRLVRSAVNTESGTTTANEPAGGNATNVSGIPQMVFVDDEGLEEQFLTDGEDTANVLDTSANRVTTPVNTTPANQSIQQTQHEELDLQPSRGPREESIVNTIDQFLDENYDDVLHTLNIQTNFSLSDGERNLTGCPVLPLGWIVPDGTNQTLEEIKDKKDFK